jgi:hypothetical protein
MGGAVNPRQTSYSWLICTNHDIRKVPNVAES